MSLARRSIVQWLVVFVVIGGTLGVLLHPGHYRMGAQLFGADGEPKSSGTKLATATDERVSTGGLEEENKAVADLRRRLVERVKPLDIVGTVKLGEAIDLLRKKYQVHIDLDESTFEPLDTDQGVKDKSVRLPRFSTPTLDHYLRRLLKDVDATYLQRGDRLLVVSEYYVTTGQHTREPVVLDLSQPTGLKQALDYLAGQYGVTIVLDPRVGELAESHVQGVFQNVGLETTILLLAEMSGLRVIRLQEAYFITSEEFAKRLPAVIRPDAMGAAEWAEGAGVPKE